MSARESILSILERIEENEIKGKDIPNVSEVFSNFKQLVESLKISDADYFRLELISLAYKSKLLKSSFYSLLVETLSKKIKDLKPSKTLEPKTILDDFNKVLETEKILKSIEKEKESKSSLLPELEQSLEDAILKIQKEGDDVHCSLPNILDQIELLKKLAIDNKLGLNKENLKADLQLVKKTFTSINELVNEFKKDFEDLERIALSQSFLHVKELEELKINHTNSKASYESAKDFLNERIEILSKEQITLVYIKEYHFSFDELNDLCGLFYELDYDYSRFKIISGNPVLLSKNPEKEDDNRDNLMSFVVPNGIIYEDFIKQIATKDVKLANMLMDSQGFTMLSNVRLNKSSMLELYCYEKYLKGFENDD